LSIVYFDEQKHMLSACDVHIGRRMCTKTAVAKTRTTSTATRWWMTLMTSSNVTLEVTSEMMLRTIEWWSSQHRCRTLCRRIDLVQPRMTRSTHWVTLCAACPRLHEEDLRCHRRQHRQGPLWVQAAARLPHTSSVTPPAPPCRAHPTRSAGVVDPDARTPVRRLCRPAESAAATASTAA